MSTVCGSRSFSEVGDEVDDRMRSNSLDHREQGFVVVDVTDGGLGSELGQELPLLRRPGQPDELMSAQVRQRRAAENTRCSGEENAHFFATA